MLPDTPHPLLDLMSGGLELLPVPVLILDRAQRVVASNHVARALLGAAPGGPLEGQRFGNILRCVNAPAHPQGCGQSEDCPDCGFHQILHEAACGGIARQREFRLVAQGEDGPRERIVLVSARALGGGAGGPAVATVVVVEDVGDLRRLRGLVPICAQCKKIRADHQEWQPLESFIEAHSLALFTHSLCPECEAEFYREIDAVDPPAPG